MNKNHSNVLLVEILIAVLFFMLSCTVIVQVFEASGKMTRKAGIRTEALAEAQNAAEAMYGTEDPGPVLEKLGFSSSHGSWSLERDHYILYIEGGFEPAGTGEMWTGNVTAYYREPGNQDIKADEEKLVSLPCKWYRGAGA